MTRQVQINRRRRSALATAAVVLACCTPASCSDRDLFELTLRVRDGDLAAPDCGPPAQPDSRVMATCRYEMEEQTWTDGRGRQAVVPAYTRTIDIVDSGVFSAISCAGRTIPLTFWERFETTQDSLARPIRLVIDDGSVLALNPEEGIWINDADDGCFAASGSWRGIAGDVEGRTGELTMVNESSVQTVLHLVED